MEVSPNAASCEGPRASHPRGHSRSPRRARMGSAPNCPASRRPPPPAQRPPARTRASMTVFNARSGGRLRARVRGGKRVCACARRHVCMDAHKQACMWPCTLLHTRACDKNSCPTGARPLPWHRRVLHTSSAISTLARGLNHARRLSALCRKSLSATCHAPSWFGARRPRERGGGEGHCYAAVPKAIAGGCIDTMTQRTSHCDFASRIAGGVLAFRRDSRKLRCRCLSLELEQHNLGGLPAEKPKGGGIASALRREGSLRSQATSNAPHK